MENKDQLSNKFKIINGKPLELTQEIINNAKSVADQLQNFGDMEAATCIRFLLNGWSSLVQLQVERKPVALRACFNGTWFYAPWVDGADITAEWEPLYAQMKGCPTYMIENKSFEDLLIRHINSSELHQKILDGFKGAYTLGIGKDSTTGKPNLILMIPEGTKQVFIKSIILEDIKFEIIAEYRLKKINPF